MQRRYDSNQSVFNKICWYASLALYKLSRLLGDNLSLMTFRHLGTHRVLHGLTGYKIYANDLGLKQESSCRLDYNKSGNETIYIGEFDQDGNIYPYCELFKGAPIVAQEKFMQRRKHQIFLVIFDGCIGVEKKFMNRRRFLNEYTALLHLNKAGFRVPLILDVDFDTLTLTLSYIFGKVLREELAKKGAILRDAQMGYVADYPLHLKNDYDNRIIAEGLRVMLQVTNSEYIEKICQQIIKIHEAGFFIGDIKYGNIIMEEKSGEPYFIDFEGSIQLKRIKSQRAREILKLRDLERFARIFGLEKSIPHSIGDPEGKSRKITTYSQKHNSKQALSKRND